MQAFFISAEEVTGKDIAAFNKKEIGEVLSAHITTGFIVKRSRVWNWILKVVGP